MASTAGVESLVTRRIQAQPSSRIMPRRSKQDISPSNNLGACRVRERIGQVWFRWLSARSPDLDLGPEMPPSVIIFWASGWHVSGPSFPASPEAWLAGKVS